MAVLKLSIGDKEFLDYKPEQLFEFWLLNLLFRLDFFEF